MNHNTTLKQVLLIVLIVTDLFAAFFNIQYLVEVVKNILAGNLTAVHTTLLQTAATWVGWLNPVLLIFLVFFYRYKKTNLLWILLPYLGSVIFGLMKLMDKNEATADEA